MSCKFNKNSLKNFWQRQSGCTLCYRLSTLNYLNKTEIRNNNKARMKHTETFKIFDLSFHFDFNRK